MPLSAAVATGTSVAVAFSSDGRVRRRERSGRAIVEAMLALVGRGTLDPTAQQVAIHAGVGIRTVFRRFSDMESLFAEMSARVQADALPLLADAGRGGDLTARAQALVARRAALFERIAPYKRAANLKRWRSPVLLQCHAQLVGALRADLVQSLPELRNVSADVTDALELVTSFEAWDRLRTEQRLRRDRAQAALERAVLGLVAGLEVAPRRSRR
jgi:AcrR family transcriptional regulator